MIIRISRWALRIAFSSCLLLASIGTFASSEDKPAAASPLSTHVLNTTSGKPAIGVVVILQIQTGKDWEEVSRTETDVRGRIMDLFPKKKKFNEGVYRLLFETGAYFQRQGVTTFYPKVEVIFAIENTDEHYHIPLLISPYGYSTYRGS